MKLSSKMIKALCYARTIFFVAFLLIDFQVQPSFIFSEDWFKLTCILLFFFINGFCVTQCMIKATELVPVSQKGQLGSFFGSAMTFAVVTGVTLAIPLQYVVNMTPVGKENLVH